MAEPSRPTPISPIVSMVSPVQTYASLSSQLLRAYLFTLSGEFVPPAVGNIGPAPAVYGISIQHHLGSGAFQRCTGSRRGGGETCAAGARSVSIRGASARRMELAAEHPTWQDI